MGPIPQTGPHSNVVKGTVTKIEGNGSIATRIYVSVDLKEDLRDNSANLDSAIPRPGRFEDGLFTFGTSQGVVQVGLTGEDGNGQHYIQRSDGIEIPFLISKENQQTVEGRVAQLTITGTSATVKLSITAGTLIANHVGGTLTFAGLGTTITSVSPETGTIEVDYVSALPFTLYDDDGPFTPALPPLDIATDAFALAYIHILADGGGNTSYDTLDVPFTLNLETIPESEGNSLINLIRPHVNSDSLRSAKYWVAYVLQGFQYETHKDYDSDYEILYPGATNFGGSIVFAEQIREGFDEGLPNNSNNEQLSFEEFWGETTAHEIGHQFGLGHDNGWLMHEFHAQSKLAFHPLDLRNLRAQIAGPAKLPAP
jgi:hypothetical protein